MAEQKNQNEHLNVEDAPTQSEAFLIKYKNAIIGGVVAVIIIVAGFIMYKNLYAEPREEKAQAALFKGQEYFEQDAFEQALNGDSIGYTGFLKLLMTTAEQKLPIWQKLMLVFATHNLANMKKQ